MGKDKSIKKAAYWTLAALLLVVAFSFWGFHRVERGETLPWFSTGAASVFGFVCAVIFFAALAGAGFIVLRAFYLGLREADSGSKGEHDGERGGGSRFP